MEHLQTPDIDINDNVIKNTAVNGSIYLDPNGTGTVQIQSNTTVNGNLSVTGNFQVNGNLSGATDIIVGDSPIDRVTVVPDFTQSIIPGTNLTYDLGQVSKRWRRAYVHDNSNITNLTYNSITISEQLQIDGATATITTLQSNDDILLNPTTGITDIERIRFQGDTITNLDPLPLTVTSTGIGYVRFVDTNALVIPSGNNTTDRPAGAEVGTTRWNTTENYMECFDGSVWSVATGGGVTVTESGMNDLGNIWTLVLG
jgi:cytoskeletal protein CcmA (bactofilin family)